MKKNLEKYIPETCECCGQTTTDIITMSKGYAIMMRQIARFLGKKGINVFHPVKELMAEGLFNHSQANNLRNLRVHGLIAKYEDEAGNWVMTRKGGEFLHGAEIMKTAIVSKKPPKHTIGYLGEEKCTFRSLMKDQNQPYWGFEVAEGNIIKKL